MLTKMQYDSLKYEQNYNSHYRATIKTNHKEPCISFQKSPYTMHKCTPPPNKIPGGAYGYNMNEEGDNIECHMNLLCGNRKIFINRCLLHAYGFLYYIFTLLKDLSIDGLYSLIKIILVKGTYITRLIILAVKVSLLNLVIVDTFNEKNHYSRIIRGICLSMNALPPYSANNREYTIN
ncbi:hypothetical protein AGLY_011831 [Aphis glycines]|uniref:Uncharacterized protein n=1 Tax=Aphis glycines TaxID=307491 RepID=A0A6G0TBQ6_APHGL|nr:hypothetical protein AGLY_011831 [Aphis glycines]